MIELTKRLRKYGVENFHFNLGVIGAGQDRGSRDIRRSNDYLIGLYHQANPIDLVIVHFFAII